MAILHVLDGTAALYRAFHGAGSAQSKDGREVGAVRGFAQSLSRILRTMRPSHVAVVFDLTGPTHRHVIDPSYKQNRPPRPPELVAQFDLARELVDALGMAQFASPGYEADDLMATLVWRARKARVRSILISPDKDVLQLLSPWVRVVEPKQLTWVDAAMVEERFGVAPQQLGDLLALAGDPSDGIRGLPGIGPKAASALLTHFGSLAAFLAATDEELASVPVRGAARLAERRAAGREHLELSRRLVRLACDAPLDPDPKQLSTLRYRGPRAGAATWLDALDLPLNLARLRSIVTSSAPALSGQARGA
ncbi:MAG: 5'-3' exonuclease [Planctomycetes bacterium]|nr:5'-3' exonuclease [Planctomycetota bacterium]